MAKKYKVKYLHDDPKVIKVRSYCWDRSIYFYPIVVSGQETSYKFVPKVRIGYSSPYSFIAGTLIYDQNDELYDKIIELYLHYYEKLNNSDNI
jgi:hypothetical protein|tara:strand:- start:1032 stop:1310 length:279 start_codon:yes stop_codon:yes gene_type:complete